MPGILLTASLASDIDKAKETIAFWFDLMAGFLRDATDAIQLGIGFFASGRDTVMLINDALQGTCYSMLGVFATIEVIQFYMHKGEETRWEDVARCLIKLIIFKNLVTITPVILNILQSTVAGVFTGDFNETAIQSIVTPFKRMAEDELSDIWNQRVEGTKFTAKLENMVLSFNVLGIKIKYVLYGVLCSGVAGLVYIMSVLRNFQMVLMAACASISMTFFAYSETKDIPKRFLLSYLAVALQGMGLIVSIVLYGGLLQSVSLDGQDASFVTLLVDTALLAFAVIKSGQWAKELVGQ